MASVCHSLCACLLQICVYTGLRLETLPIVPALFSDFLSIPILFPNYASIIILSKPMDKLVSQIKNALIFLTSEEWTPQTKMTGPNVSLIRRFYCTYLLNHTHYRMTGPNVSLIRRFYCMYLLNHTLTIETILSCFLQNTDKHLLCKSFGLGSHITTHFYSNVP